MKKLLQNLNCQVFSWALIIAGLLSFNQVSAQTLTIGSGTGTTSYFPIYGYYGYNYSQQIYTAAELDAAIEADGGTAGTAMFIDKIRFKAATSVASTNFLDWVVYLGNTTVTSFTGTSSWVSLSDLTEVYDGTITNPLVSGTWMEITLDVPFFWDGSSNLLVAVDENTSNYTSCSWSSYSAGSNRGILYYSDGTNPDPASPPSANYGPNSSLAQVQFGYYPATACEEIALEAGTLTSMETCPAQPFTVLNVGSSMGVGFERVWQMRFPSGTGTWTTIAGATATNYYDAVGITDPTDYRCIVTCNTTGDVDTTNVATISISPFTDCYCIPSSMYTGYNVTKMETTAGVTNFSNTSSDYITSPGYSDYSEDYSVSQVQGVDVSFSATTLYSSENLSIWVDWNQNGLFEDTEEVYSYLTSSGTGSFSGTFTVPLTALSGNTKMRVRSAYYYYSFYEDDGVFPCGSIFYGEAEDYTFTVIPALPCEEIDLVAGTLSDAERCPDVTFNISNVGTSLGLGFDRVWQSSPAGAGTWTTIIGATSPNLTVTGGVSTATDYRCIVSCPASGETDTTNIAAISISPFIDCYCIPSSMYTAYNVTKVETTLGATNFSNTSSDFITSPGYSDYSDIYAVSQIQGEDVSFSATTFYSSENLSIWVDWNQNGVFETTEEVYSYLTSSGAGSFSGTFTVPLTALSGNTKMRVRSAYYYDSYYTDGGVFPCGTINYGEAEDYTFTVIPALPCEELDLVAGTLSDAERCPDVSFIVSNVGTSLGLGFDRVWQSSPAGAGTWTTIVGAIDPSLIVSAGITEATDYRCIVSCPASGESDTTNIAAISLSPFTDCYCVPVATYSGYNVTNMTTTLGVTNFSNSSSGYITSLGYSDYSDLYSVSQVQGVDVDFSATTLYGSENLSIWVDWNQNGIFEGAEEVYSYLTSSGAGSFTGSFTVPLTALSGNTKMRVRSAYYYYSFYTDGGVFPCGTIYYGEAEDYTFTVIPAISCADASVSFPSTVTSNSFPENVCGTGDVNLSLTTTMPIASGITYEWQSSSSATGPWTAISTPSIFSTYFHTGVTANTYFRCNIRCEGSTQMYSEVILVQSVIPETPVLTEGQTCGPGSVDLTGTIGSGDIFWFEAATGGMAFGSGTTVATPSIATTTTFYAAGGAFPPSQIEIGTDNNTTYYYDPGPFNQYYRKYTMQLMYTKAQFEAQGAIPGNFDAISFYLSGSAAVPFPDYTVSVKTVSAASMSTLTWQTTGFTEVFGGTGTTYTPGETGWQQLDFTTPMNWDGNSHVIVQVCWSQNTGSSYASGGTNWYSNKPGQMLFNATNTSGSACGLTGATTSSYLPDAIFNFTGCVSERVPVTAYVREVPVINIDVEDGEYCLFNNTFNIPTSPAQPASSTYIWNTGANTADITVSTEGIPTNFWVEVTNEWGCIASDSVNLTLKPSPEVDLGPDTMVCEGGVVTLDAGNPGDGFYWNTGETTKEIIVDDGGTYNVIVTNEFGCMGSDTIGVVIDGFAPSVDGIIVDNMGATTFQFSPFHPLNVLSYSWDFGDSTATSMSENPIHTYSAPGTYMVTLTITSSCGEREFITYATIVQSVDQFEMSENSLKLYPNPASQLINIETLGGIKMNKLTVINMLGQEVYTQELNKVADFQLDVSRFTNGAYHILIESDKGRMVKKFQILK